MAIKPPRKKSSEISEKEINSFIDGVDGKKKKTNLRDFKAMTFRMTEQESNDMDALLEQQRGIHSKQDVLHIAYYEYCQRELKQYKNDT